MNNLLRLMVIGLLLFIVVGCEEQSPVDEIEENTDNFLEPLLGDWYIVSQDGVPITHIELVLTFSSNMKAYSYSEFTDGTFDRSWRGDITSITSTTFIVEIYDSDGGVNDRVGEINNYEYYFQADDLWLEIDNHYTHRFERR
ncbi:MAG: hypothetical protein HOD37_10580 [Bacteroidetes bacterium]|jgi:hypothetical protein|nr:hypothetical protein [Bacteroidota bacterium]